MEADASWRLLQYRHEMILLFPNPFLICWQGREDHVRAPAAHLGWMQRHKFAHTLLCFYQPHNNHKVYHLK